jgi:hypothetical protein
MCERLSAEIETKRACRVFAERERLCMKKCKLKALMLLIVAACIVADASGQSTERALVCKREVFRMLKPLPVLSYECRAGAANDYDEAILKWPERVRAINDYLRRLVNFSDDGWWAASVDDLNVCYFHGDAGALGEEEAERFRRGDYALNLFGNGRLRLVHTPDPCYQTGYGGSNAFLLYRLNGSVTVTQVLDGYFSRADNSVALDLAQSKGEQIIEVATTTGGLNPYTTNYYFAIDRRTGKAVAKKIFKDGKSLSNKITSVLILDDGTFPQAYAEMRIVEGGRLADRFYTYSDTGGRGIITDASGRKLRRITYRWNGRYYNSG